MVIDTWDKLFNAVKSDVLSVMNSMDSEWKSDNNNPKYVMMQHVDSDVYSYTPAWYDPQPRFQLRDSITAGKAKMIGGDIFVGLYHDTNKMDYDPSYPRHGSTSGDIREFIPDILEGEIKWGVNDVFPATGAWRRATHYQRNTVQDLQSGRLKTWLKSNLRKRGYTIPAIG